MAPALAVASKWLEAPEARKGYWHRLLFGTPTLDKANVYHYWSRNTVRRDEPSFEHHIFLRRDWFWLFPTEGPSLPILTPLHTL
jgi:hypothetical protein